MTIQLFLLIKRQKILIELKCVGVVGVTKIHHEPDVGEDLIRLNPLGF